FRPQTRGANALAHLALVVVHLGGVDMPVTDPDGLFGQPRTVAAAQGPRAKTNDRNPEPFCLDELHGFLLVFAIVRETAKIQSPPPGFACLAGSDHRIRHGSFKIVIEELAALVARCDPGTLHLTHLADLLVIEFRAQAAKTVIEDIVPHE